ERETRGIGDPNRYTVAQYLAHWLAMVRDRNELSPTTLSGYERCIKIATPWVGDIPLAKLTARDLDRAYGHMVKRGGRTRGRSKNRQARPLSARAVLNTHRMLHTSFEAARRWKLVGENVAKDARAPSPERSRARAFAIEEVAKLMTAAAADP